MELTTLAMSSLQKWIIAGDISLIETDSKTRQTREIVGSVVHPYFSNVEYSYDLAIATVNDPFLFTVSVQKITLCENPPAVDLVCTNAGWGATKLTSRPTPSPYLMFHYVKIIDHYDCRKKFFEPDLICTFSKKSVAYKGDSGGPLICKGKLCGVLSAYQQDYEKINLFANVARSYKWITTNGTQGCVRYLIQKIL
ncbi:unnamed protein product [Hermetia illucens]|uniref:Peptidase S1 domain-containing protein n=1 Tax=Hermetia illucens TaxID=343691 RepID=A0A7R8YP40_HERIL|nr:unnamed protein product [Hermetia illucens]